MPKVSKKEEKDKKTDSKKSQRKVTKKTSGKKPTVKTIDKKPDNTKNKDEYLSSIFTPKTVKSKFDARNEKPKKANILDTDKTVVLPSAPSPRLLEKARVYKLWYEINSSKVIARVARFGGYVFVLLGSGLLMTTWATANTSSFQHLATTVCSETGVCIDDGFKEEEGGGTTADLPSTENLLPSVNFLSALSAELSTDTEFIVQGLNVTDLILNLYSHSDGSNLELHKKRITEGSKYYFLIPAKSLPAGEYTIKAKAIALDEETKHFFTGPEFAVPKPTEESVEVIDTASTTEDINDENSQKTKSEVNDNEKEEEEDKSITNKDKEEDDIIKEEINSESDNLATESTENEIINKVEEVAVSQFSLNIQKTTGSNEAKLVITGDDLRFVEIYAIPEMSTISRFLGLAKKVDDKWHYFVEYNHIPKGKYKLFASTKIKDETKNSNSVFYESKFEAKA